MLALSLASVFQSGSFAASLITGEIGGTALAQGRPLSNTTVRLRNLDNGQLIATQTTNERGRFRFTGVTVGLTVVEVLAPGGSLVGTSSPIALTSGAPVADAVTVRASAAALPFNQAPQPSPSQRRRGGFFTTTLGIVTLAAIGAGIVGLLIAAQDDSSPSR